MNINIDTSKFLYDPKDISSLKKLKVYKEFKKEPDGLPWDRVVPYVILMYDPASKELEQRYPYLPQRKMSVAKMVRLVTGDHVAKEVEDMLIGKSDYVNSMIIRYLKLFNNPDMLMLAAYKEIFASLNKSAFEGSVAKGLVASIEKVYELINNLTDKILKGKDETKLRTDLYVSIEGHGLGLKVEDIAEKLKRGEEPFPDVAPYGSGYKIGNLKFIGDK